MIYLKMTIRRFGTRDHSVLYALVQFRYPLQCGRFYVPFQIAETPWSRKPARLTPPRVRRKSVISAPLYVQCHQVQSTLSSGAPRSVIFLEKMSGDLKKIRSDGHRKNCDDVIINIDNTVWVASGLVNTYNYR